MTTGVVAITDYGWYEFLRARPALDEANFWKPSARRGMNAPAFAPFFFKLRAPENAICGFGYFARFSRLPPWMAWEAFGEGNGCRGFGEMQQRIEEIRARIGYQPPEGPDLIGCALIASPVFFPEGAWVGTPSDWKVPTQTDKRYDLTMGEGLRVWEECWERSQALTDVPGVAEAANRYGKPVLVLPRIGQGIFRVATTEAYRGACAVTGEHSLPALEASHIRPYSEGGPHAVSNGLLLRADLHRLFDRGYVTVTPEARLQVSERLYDEFKNGRTYRPLHDSALRLPKRADERPASDFLRWHNEEVFVA
jgi:putative restriction endonuclease